MMSTNRQFTDSLEVLMAELVTDAELLSSFLLDPERTLERASDWELPLSESELQALRRPAYRLRDRVAEELETRLLMAA